MILSYILYISLLAICFLLVHFLIKTLIELKKSKFINSLLESVNEQYEERLIQKRAKELLEGESSEKKFIDKVDDLILVTNIKSFMPFLTSEILISITIGLATLSSVLVYLTYRRWFYTISMFIAIVFLVYFALKIIARITFNKIDKDLQLYVNNLDNFSGTNDDIVTIIEKSMEFLSEPLKSYSDQFVSECNNGIPLKKAFKSFENKVENKRFKQLLRNLRICSQRDGDYSKILDKSSIILKDYFIEKEARKKKVRANEIAIIIILALGALSFKIMSNIMQANVLDYLLSNNGRSLLGYCLIVFIYSIYKFMTLDKLNY